MGTSADSSRGVAPVLFGFVGREYLPALGLYYFRARFYDPRLGRFLSPDPIGPAVDDPATLDRYAYARNAPTRPHAARMTQDSRCGVGVGRTQEGLNAPVRAS